MKYETGIWVERSKIARPLSIDNIVKEITIRLTKSAITPTAPLPNTSDKASTSLVSLVNNFPTGILSWNLKERDIECSKSSLLILAVNFWPTACMLYDWYPCKTNLKRTEKNNVIIIKFIDCPKNVLLNQTSEVSFFKTVIACPTNRGWIAPANDTGKSTATIKYIVFLSLVKYLPNFLILSKSFKNI